MLTENQRRAYWKSRKYLSTTDTPYTDEQAHQVAVDIAKLAPQETWTHWHAGTLVLAGVVLFAGSIGLVSAISFAAAIVGAILGTLIVACALKPPHRTPPALPIPFDDRWAATYGKALEEPSWHGIGLDAEVVRLLDDGWSLRQALDMVALERKTTPARARVYKKWKIISIDLAPEIGLPAPAGYEFDWACDTEGRQWLRQGAHWFLDGKVPIEFAHRHGSDHALDTHPTT